MLADIATYYRFTLKELLFWFAAWTLLAVIMAQTEIADANRMGYKLFDWEPWSWAFSASYGYAILSPVLVYFCHRWPFEKKHYIKTASKLILLYIPVALLFTSLMFTLRHLTYWIILGHSYPIYDIASRYLYEFPKSISFFAIVIFITYTRIFQQSTLQEKLNAARLHGELVDAKLDVLQSQLQPHFLFNTLNLISSTMYQNVDKADSIITRLADLLRYSLATQQKPFISLQQELDAMKSYLEIAQLRFGERLTTDLQIDPQALPVLIPAMLLQPLLENAVKYGIEPSDNGGSITLIATIKQDLLVIKIINSQHQQKAEGESFGIGLENTKKRLRYLYQEKASLRLVQIDAEKIELIITLPVEQLHHAG